MSWLNNNERSYEKGITEEDLFCIIIFTDHPQPSMATLADRVGDLVSAQPFNSSLWPNPVWSLFCEFDLATFTYQNRAFNGSRVGGT